MWHVIFKIGEREVYAHIENKEKFDRLLICIVDMGYTIVRTYYTNSKGEERDVTISSRKTAVVKS